MDKIKVSEMEFYGYHGVFEAENKLGQRFRVNAVLELDLTTSAKSDDVEDSINYADVYKTCKSVVEGETFNLVETIAETIADKMLQQFDKLQRVTIEVIKPDPPIPGHYKSVAIEITRSRS
ncbi:dihydroneopterin aldolase [Jeotgalibacillus sp. R-1-5s-1]|uniref:dihydroneopterin aldolase n=1 Tax=Jeotgalibacillus sp. R-1-5s-1 TaxID=2555897 RepID=UPI00106D8356|nr:dihydroneopterin aldolase [Jeotgalibacillus sp. R-1-5s-1]TFE01943.1 dihydroneopterin aldolase [Jeotgalibacillus sp. R-1-5s-1]